MQFLCLIKHHAMEAEATVEVWLYALGWVVSFAS